MRGQDDKENVVISVHASCLRLQRFSERFDGRIAAPLGIESYDDRAGSEPGCDDFRCAVRLAAENALTAEKSE